MPAPIPPGACPGLGSSPWAATPSRSTSWGSCSSGLSCACTSGRASNCSWPLTCDWVSPRCCPGCCSRTLTSGQASRCWASFPPACGTTGSTRGASPRCPRTWISTSRWQPAPTGGIASAFPGAATGTSEPSQAWCTTSGGRSCTSSACWSWPGARSYETSAHPHERLRYRSPGIQLDLGGASGGSGRHR